MKYAQKWNYETRSYDDYLLPEGSILFTENMDELVACAQCGKTITFGKCYTSKEIHTSIGLGFPVCGDCYEEEIDREESGYLLK